MPFRFFKIFVQLNYVWRPWPAGAGGEFVPLFSDKNLMEEPALLFYTKSKDESLICLLPFTPPVLCLLCSALSLNGEQHVSYVS